MNKVERIAENVCAARARATDMPLLAATTTLRRQFFFPKACCARRGGKKRLTENAVPPVCVLDPDGDLVAYARIGTAARPSPRTGPATTRRCGSGRTMRRRFGIIGVVVGGPFAVLVAEQLFACGCELLISITSAGQIADVGPTALLHSDRPRAARRGHELPLSAAGCLRDCRSGTDRAGAQAALRHIRIKVYIGPAWTTDAPYRETEQMIAARKAEGHPRGRDGKRRALRLCRGARPSR